MPIETTRGQDGPQAPVGAGSEPAAGTTAMSERPAPDTGSQLGQAFARPTGGSERAPGAGQLNAARTAWPDQWREDVAAQYAGKTDRDGK